MKSRLPKHQLPMDEIASRYLAGETSRALAEAYKSALAGSPRPEEVIRRRLKHMGVARRPRGWQNQRGSRNQQWKGGYKTPMHFHRRQSYEVAAICLGKPVEAKVVIHHIDENPFHNCPENLMLFPNQNKHARYHQQLLCLLREGWTGDTIQLAKGNGAVRLQRPISLIGWKPDKGLLCLCEKIGETIGVQLRSGEFLRDALQRELQQR